jgi:signal peptidase I
MSPEAAAYPDIQPIRILTEPRPRARRRGGVTRSVSSVLLGSVVVLILVAIVGMVLGLWRFTVIDTGSMRPTLNPGDVAILTPERPADLQKGQIVAFHPPGEPRLTVIHRAFSIDRASNQVIIQTKGDANNATDQWRAHIVGHTVWREKLKLPALGYLAVWSKQPSVRVAVLSVVVILLVSLLLGWIWRPNSP